MKETVEVGNQRKWMGREQTLPSGDLDRGVSDHGMANRVGSKWDG